MLRAALTALTLLALAVPAEAQLLKEIKETARQKVTERKERTKAHAVQRATEPVDSALERGIQPVDSFVAKAATGAGAAVSRLGREDEAAAAEAERQLRPDYNKVQQRSSINRVEKSKHHSKHDDDRGRLDRCAASA